MAATVCSVAIPKTYVTMWTPEGESVQGLFSGGLVEASCRSLLSGHIGTTEGFRFTAGSGGLLGVWTLRRGKAVYKFWPSV